MKTQHDYDRDELIAHLNHLERVMERIATTDLDAMSDKDFRKRVQTMARQAITYGGGK